MEKRRQLRYTLDLLYTLVARDIKVKYRRSILGIGWSLMNPILQLAVFSFVFQFLLPLRIPDYTVFLFSGIIVWNWFQTSLMSATGAIVDNAALVKQPGFPDALLPAVSVLSNLVNFLLAIPILIAFLLVKGHFPAVAIFALPLVVAVQFLFTLSLAYALAGAHVSLRDTQYLLSIILMLGFYLAPVFYDPSSIPSQYQWLYSLDPLVPIIGAYRRIMLANQFPDFRPLLWTSLFSSVLLLATSWIFARARHKFVEEI
jgi:lipopolysaccharide transport system permease protein